MKELLANEAVQTALVVVIVTALNALVNWLKRKFPTQAASVESNWCYLQPVVEAAMNEARAAMGKSAFGHSAATGIVSKALVDFVDAYRKFEGKYPAVAELDAARAEIADAVERETGG